VVVPGEEFVESTESETRSIIAPPKITENTMKSLLAENKWRLFGTSMTWFLFDIAFYAQSLFNPTVLSIIGFDEKAGSTPINKLILVCEGQLIIALFAIVPGYWVAVFTIEKLGRRFIQLLGFAATCILYLILSLSYNSLVNSTTAALYFFVFLYALTFFFCNFGPNTTTFVIPSELFPTKIRSLASGISAASGKAGAILTAFAFPQLIVEIGLPAVLGILGLCSFLGFIVTYYCVPETKGKELNTI